MNTNNLPPLPEPFINMDYTVGAKLAWGAQMREYGQLCRQPLLDTIEQQRKLLEQARDAMDDHELYTHEAEEAFVAITNHLRQQEGETK